MFSIKSRLTWAFIFLAMLSGCSNQISIESPTDDSYHAIEPPDQFSISFSDDSSIPVYTVELNNNDVTSEFTNNGAFATASGAALKPYLIPGNNIITVVAGSAQDSAVFYYDIEGPLLHVTEVTEGEIITVTGTAVDRGGIDSITINDVAVTFLGTTYERGTRRDFTIDLPNDRFMQVISSDYAGNTTNKVYARRDVIFSPGISARINSSGLDFLTSEMSEIFSNMDLSKNIDPIRITDIFGTGFIVEVTDLGWGDDVQIDVEVMEGENNFGFDVSANDVVIGLEITYLTFGIPWLDLGLADGTLTVSNISLSSDIMAGIGEGDISVALENTNLNLTGLNFNYQFLPSYLDVLMSGFINDFYETFEGIFFPIVIDSLENFLVPLLDDFLETIPLDFAFDLNGERIQFIAVPEVLNVTDGGVNLILGTHMEAETLNKPALGSPAVVEETPELDSVTPNGRPFDVSAIISGNFLNQALLAAHESGLTTITLDVSSNGSLTYDGLEIIKAPEDEIEPGDVYRIIFDPASPPVIDLGNTGGAMGKLYMSNAYFSFQRKRAGEANYTNIFGVELDVAAFFDLGVQDNGNLDVGIVGLPEINILHIDDDGVIRYSEWFARRVVDYLVPLAIPQVARLLQSVPLPSIAGYGMRPEQIWSPEPMKTHIAFAGSLVKTGATTLSPDTLLEVVGDVVNLVVSDTKINIENGRVTLFFDADSPSTGYVQYRFRTDYDEWSMWSEQDQVTLERLLGGEHTVEVCSRSGDLVEDSSCETTTFVTAAQ